MKKLLLTVAVIVGLTGNAVHAQGPAPTDNCGVGYYMPCGQFKAALNRNLQAEREYNARLDLQARGQIPTQAAINKLLADNEEGRRIDATIEPVCNGYARGFISKGDYLATVSAIRDYCRDPANVQKAHVWQQKMQMRYPPHSAAWTDCVSRMRATSITSYDMLYGGMERIGRNIEAYCTDIVGR